MALTFRLAKPEDCTSIRALFLTTLEPMAKSVGQNIPTDAYSQLADKIGERNLYLLEKDGALKAAMAFHEEDKALYIDTLAVQPMLQCQGIGSRLLREAEMIAESRELYRLKLHTPEVMDHLIEFYQSHGYREHHRALPEHGLDTCLRVHFIKELDQHGMIDDMDHEHDRVLIDESMGA
ncbi:MAG: GNAT family N-acetyltransferase [Cohaesibacter sp.]|nr:GNAT family N-acetyltransferase [Cohaesibacter sp.]